MNSSTYHKKDGTAIRAILKLEVAKELQVLSEQMLIEAEEKIEQDAPKIEVYDDLIVSEEVCLVRSVAKLIGLPPQAFQKLLRVRGHLNQDNSPSTKAINAGYMRQKIHTFNYYGVMKYNITALVTMKGIIFYRKRFGKIVDEVGKMDMVT
jgi:phage antirepressor YoqD-like protein